MTNPNSTSVESNDSFNSIVETVQQGHFGPLFEENGNNGDSVVDQLTVIEERREGSHNEGEGGAPSNSTSNEEIPDHILKDLLIFKQAQNVY